MHASVTFALSLLSAVLIFYVLAVGETILVPLVVAIFIWYLINALTEGLKRVMPVGRAWRLPLAIGIIVLVMWYPVNLIQVTIPEVVRAAPEYQQNIQAMLRRILAYFELEQATVITSVTDSLNFGKLASGFARAAADFTGNAVLIILYIVFLLLEQNSFQPKLVAIFQANGSREKAQKVIRNIYQRVQSYIWIKTLMSLLTAGLSYGLMTFVGLDFAGFWAVLIFFLNFIPSIGSVIATVFPALLALVQFADPLAPFLMIVLGISAFQFLIGNVLEPKLMGDTMNLSPIVIMLSLVVWGSLWGVAGMFLCVPMTVMAAIILAEFPRTRPVAILLSSNGKV